MPKKHNITYKNIAKFSRNFNKKRTNKVFKNANTKSNFENIITKSDYVQNKKRVFKKFIDVKTEATDQKNSGRCWIFAFLNIIRINMIKKYNLDNFEFSQNYLFFYHNLEQANYFLNYIYDTKNKKIKNTNDYSIKDLEKIYMLDNLTSDGGQWKLFYGLVKKYGLIPKTTMDDHYHSKNTKQLKIFYNNFLRKAAFEIRNSNEKREIILNRILQNCYKILVFFLGEPPKKITWQYYTNISIKDKDKDKDNRENKKQKVVENITPLNFYKKIVPYNIDNKICLINYPCKEMPFYKCYDVDLGYRVLGENRRSMINVPINIMLELSKKSIDNDEAVWSGVDWNKYRSSSESFLDKEGFNLNDMFGFDNNMEKCNALNYRQSSPSHAVILRGYNFEKGKTNGFLVENSHGKQEKGFKENYYMSEKWFNEYVFTIVVDKNVVNKKILKCLKQTPTILPFWSPFSNLLNIK